jgi:hypothetical protein
VILQLQLFLFAIFLDGVAHAVLIIGLVGRASGYQPHQLALPTGLVTVPGKGVGGIAALQLDLGVVRLQRTGLCREQVADLFAFFGRQTIEYMWHDLPHLGSMTHWRGSGTTNGIDGKFRRNSGSTTI